MLVADALRLGGAILGTYPDMLAPQLVGRLLPEAPHNPAVASLLKQCHDKGKNHCALLPSHHCLHTPGGPLKVRAIIVVISCYNAYCESAQVCIINLYIFAVMQL